MKKITDKERIKYMLSIKAIGGGWHDPDEQIWPDTWDSQIMRVVVDAAIMAGQKRWV